MLSVIIQVIGVDRQLLVIKYLYPEPAYDNNDVSVDSHMMLFNFVSSQE